MLPGESQMPTPTAGLWILLLQQAEGLGKSGLVKTKTWLWSTLGPYMVILLQFRHLAVELSNIHPLVKQVPGFTEWLETVTQASALRVYQLSQLGWRVSCQVAQFNWSIFFETLRCSPGLGPIDRRF